jgi:hypothetical protein
LYGPVSAVQPAWRSGAAKGKLRYKENAMIKLTEEQLQALDTPEQPPVAVDPRTGQEYLLIRREVYELVRATLKPYGRGWDDPADDDLIRKDL